MKLDYTHLHTSIKFGHTTVDEYGASFYAFINDAVMQLVRSLPRSVQTHAMMFFLHYAGIEPGQQVNFFKNYYSPVWSSIPHILCKCKGSIAHKEFIPHTATSHAMLMLLHSLDDHIHDGQITPDHVTLLIRSQAWKMFWDHITTLYSNVRGQDIVHACINRYYASITQHNNVVSLEDYLNICREQMATGLIVPLIVVKFTGDASLERMVRASLESFGIAWRLLDDIHDLEDDLNKGRISAVTLCLPEEISFQWKKLFDEEIHNKRKEVVMKHKEDIIQRIVCMLQDLSIISFLVERIIKEMNAAAQHAVDAGLSGLSKEMSELLTPLVAMREADSGE